MRPVSTPNFGVWLVPDGERARGRGGRGEVGAYRRRALAGQHGARRDVELVVRRLADEDALAEPCRGCRGGVRRAFGVRLFQVWFPRLIDNMPVLVSVTR